MDENDEMKADGEVETEQVPGAPALSFWIDLDGDGMDGTMAALWQKLYCRL
jgi:hypothetical protein